MFHGSYFKHSHWHKPKYSLSLVIVPPKTKQKKNYPCNENDIILLCYNFHVTLDNHFVGVYSRSEAVITNQGRIWSLDAEGILKSRKAIIQQLATLMPNCLYYLSNVDEHQ